MNEISLRNICATVGWMVLLTVGSWAQTDKAKTDAPKPPGTAQPAPQRRLPLSEMPRVTLADLNIQIMTDNRIIATMAALNAAGYDFEAGNRQLSGLRQQLREDVKTLSPSLARRLRDHFTKHSQGRNDAAAVAPYLSLALTLTDAPVFSIDTPVDKLPEDVREITEFALLLQEFWRDTKFGTLMPKYKQAYELAAKTYPTSTASAVANVIQYLHTEPVLELPPTYIPRAQGGGRGIIDEGLKAANRIRKFVVMPDLLNASNAVNVRVVRDTYYVLLGATVDPHAAVRRAFLRFTIDPLIDREIKEVAAIGPELRKLRDSRGDKLAPEYKEGNAYFLIADSFTRAVDTRLEGLESLAVRRFENEKAFQKALDEEHERALYELSFPYERGAVLVYHFYDQMRQAENVGIDVKQFLGSLLQSIKFDVEAARLTDYAQRIERYKAAREMAAKTAPNLAAAISNADEGVIKQLDEADRMIRAEQYNDARALLKGVLQQKSNNARAYFGLAEIGSKIAAKMKPEEQSKRDEELYATIQYYKDAAENASPETEKWLIQRSYVAAARILDFLGHNDDAMAAYDLAVKLGDVPNGAYQEAVKALKEKEANKKP
ncbi:MAG TPA: hypothetical protein VFZ34_19365 [Blastocatellia bacterium]|nr:hypothetical protein [Blastocatellia bacterium]